MAFSSSTYSGLCPCKIWSQLEHFENLKIFWFLYDVITCHALIMIMRIDWMIFLWSTYLGLCSCKISSQLEHFKNFENFLRGGVFWWRHHGGYFEKCVFSTNVFIEYDNHPNHHNVDPPSWIFVSLATVVRFHIPNVAIYTTMVSVESTKGKHTTGGLLKLSSHLRDEVYRMRWTPSRTFHVYRRACYKKDFM